MHISADDYEVSFSPDQPELLHLKNTLTGENTTLTFTEALSLLKLMLKHKDELYALRKNETA